MESTTGRGRGRGWPSRLLPLAAVLAAAGAVSFFKVLEPDVFWHLKTGQLILERGALLRTNTFAGTYPDFPWHNLEWLHQVVLALFHRVGGWEGVLVFKLLTVGAAVALLHRLLVRRAGRPWAAAAVVVFVLSLARVRLVERPQIISLLLFVVVLLLVERARRRGGRSAWLLPPLFALWSNVHPEFALGLLYLAGVAAGDWLNRLDGRPRPAVGGPPLGVVALLCVPATLLNPETYHPLLKLLATARETEAAVAITEYERASLANAPLFWVMLALLAALGAARFRRRDWAALLPAAGMAIIAATLVRAVGFFALAAALPLHRLLCALARRPRAARAAHGGLAALGAAAALVWTMKFNQTQLFTWGYGPDENYHPIAAAEFLAAHDLPGALYNHYNQGGYLLWRLFPRWGVFQDTRGECYPREFIASLQAKHSRQEFERLFAQFDVNTALVKIPEAGLMFPQGEWGVVFWDQTFCLLVRRTEATRPVLEALEYRVFAPGATSIWDMDPANLAAALPEMRRNQRERHAPDWRLERDIGIAAGRLRRHGEAEEALRAALALAPGEASVWAFLGRALADQGRGAEAREMYGKALEIQPDLPQVKRWLSQLDARR